jgi:cyclopropane fatty-acyl-phospholipid synthase-like methyltransferase
MQKMISKDDVDALFSAAATSAALGAAIETGLLWLLAERPLNAGEVASALEIPEKRCRYWLQLLSEMGILEYGPDGYAPSTLARTAILDRWSRESWVHLAMDERERSAGVHNLALYMHEPGSVWVAQGMTEPKNYVEKMRASPTRAREFARMLYELHQCLSSDLAEVLDLAGVHSLLDVGGGSGVISMALLRKSPALAATVLDIENACIAGREIAAENSLSDRITYQVADITKDAFPSGFDLVMLCDVGIFGEDLIRRMRDSLNPGGRLVIVYHFSPEEGLAPTRLLEWSFLASLENPNFSIPTIQQVQAQLSEAGLQIIPGLNTTSTGWIVIQARNPL